MIVVKWDILAWTIFHQNHNLSRTSTRWHLAEGQSGRLCSLHLCTVQFLFLYIFLWASIYISSQSTFVVCRCICWEGYYSRSVLDRHKPVSRCWLFISSPNEWFGNEWYDSYTSSTTNLSKTGCYERSQPPPHLFVFVRFNFSCGGASLKHCGVARPALTDHN